MMTNKFLRTKFMAHLLDAQITANSANTSQLPKDTFSFFSFFFFLILFFFLSFSFFK